jgi:hypothetical protein
MKIQNILITFTASVLVLGAFSCKRVLDTEPQNSLDASTRFKTISDFDFALTGAYALFRSGNYYNSGSSAYGTLPDMMSDNLSETSESLFNYDELTNWGFAQDEANLTGTWVSVYNVVANINRMLANIDAFASTNAGAVNRIKGQALAIRALAHFDLMRYWVDDYDRNSTKPGIPYVTTFNYTALPARGTVKDDYTALEADLHQAWFLMRSSLDHSINTNAGVKARLDQYGVDAIMARMYLYSNQLDSAIKYSTLAINKYPLADFNDFPNVWTDSQDPTTEVIWTVVFNAGEGRVGDNVYFVPSNRSSYEPDPSVLSQYDFNNDIRTISYFAVFPDNNGNDRLILSKYLAKASQLTNPDGVVNWKSFRAGEMYLIRAEAYARKGQNALGLADLDKLRQARVAGWGSGGETGLALINAIAIERQKELIGEGHRWFDLKRTSRTISRTGNCSSCDLAPTDRAWTWPIPQDEINANPNILPQNPGY